MAIVFDAAVPPIELTTFVREIPTPADFAFSNAFPSQTVADNTVDFGSEIVRTNRTARYRSYDGRIHVSERDAGSGKRVRLAPLSSSLTQGEYERLQIAFAQTGGTNTGALVNAIYNDADILTREIRARIEQAWGDVLTDGVLSINENGFTSTADFGMPAAHRPTAATLWSAAGAKPLSDLLAWRDVYVQTNGVQPGAIRTSQRVLSTLSTNAEIVAATVGTQAGRTFVTLAEVNALLQTVGLPAFAPAYDTQVQVDGVNQRVMPEDRLLFTPASLGDLGYTCFGLTATALELVGSSDVDLSFADAPGIVGVVEKVGPPYRQHTLVDAVGMPLLTNAARLLTAKVL